MWSIYLVKNKPVFISSHGNDNEKQKYTNNIILMKNRISYINAEDNIVKLYTISSFISESGIIVKGSKL
jgi:uncharacterized protein YehS (DUF1456 family)